MKRKAFTLDDPGNFAFYYRRVLLDNVDEKMDWNWAVKGYAYKSAKGVIKRF